MDRAPPQVIDQWIAYEAWKADEHEKSTGGMVDPKEALKSLQNG